MKRKVIGNIKPGLLFILSAPAGTGKTTLMQMITKEFPSVIASISFTTRPPRGSEVNGVDYHFVSEEEFLQKIKHGDFLEYVQLYGHYYGTSKKWVEEKLAQGNHVLLVIDTQGAALLKEKVDAISVFLSPPSLEVLELRLVNRKTDSPEVIRARLERAKEEMKMINLYDYCIVNDNLEVAYAVLRSILIAEEHKIR